MLDKKVLYTRAVTAVIFAVIVIFLLNFSRLSIFVFLAIVGFATAYEYIKIKIGKKAELRELLIAPFLFGVAPLAIDYFTSQLNSVGFVILLVFTIIFDLILIFNLFARSKKLTETNFIVFVEVLFYIGIPLLLVGNLFLLGSDSKSIMIFVLILLIWANDTFAYLTGSMFGKNKLMPSISPKKTIEGFVGGGVFAILTSILLYNYFNMFPVYFYIILAIIVWILGTIGDLIESKLKRTYNIKDSGTIMPGHGGFLDRFDSFIFVLPFLVLLTYLFQNIF